MTKTKKAAISVALILLICVPMMLLLCACEPEYNENGVLAKIYPRYSEIGYARVCEVDVGESRICEIPAYVEYKGQSYPVKEVAPYGAILFSRGNHLICENAVEMIIPETVEKINFNSFYVIYPQQFDSLERVTIHPDNPVYKSIDGVVYSKDGSELIFYPPAKTDSTFTVPKEMTSIDQCEYNFNNAFITSIEVEEGNSYLTVVENSLCANNGRTLLYFPYSTGPYFAIPDGVEEASLAFLIYSNIDYLYVPSSFKEITNYTPSENDEGMIYNHPFRFFNLYFESATLPEYLVNVDLNERYTLKFGVTREEFDAIADANRVA